MSDGLDETREVVPPEPTVRLGQPALRSGQVALIFVAIAAASFLVGIVIASSQRSPSADPVIAQQDVGPAGGTVRFEGGALRVPKGALDHVEHIVVRRAESTGDRSAYRFEPVAISFDEPAELTFRLDRARNAAVYANGDDVRLLPVAVDVDRETVTVEIEDFTFDG